MKLHLNFARRMVTALFCTAVALSMASIVNAQQPGKVVVRAVKGDAFIIQPGSTVEQPLKRNFELAPGTVIKTRKGASVDMHMGQMAGVLRVKENSSLKIERYTVTQTGADSVIDLGLNLPQGTIQGNVNKLSAASRYEVKIPSGVAGIRGTRFQISATAAIIVTEGQVRFARVNPAGDTIVYTIDANQRYTTEQLVQILTDQGLITEINQEILTAVKNVENALNQPPVAPPPPGTVDQPDNQTPPPPPPPGTETIITPGSGQ